MLFKENFNRICKENHTTPTTLLKKHNITVNNVTRWNRGSLPKEEMLIQLAKYLNCNVSDFFKTEEEKNSNFSLTDDEMDIINIYRKLDRKQQHQFMNMVYEVDNT